MDTEEVHLGHTDPRGVSTRTATEVARYLLYRFYDPDRQRFLNQDDTEGMFWECRAQANPSSAAPALEALLTALHGTGVVLQVIQWADPGIEPVLKQFTGSVVRPQARDAISAHVRDLKAQAASHASASRLRRTRLFVAAKRPHELDDTLAHTIESQLTAAHLSPVRCDAGALLAFLRPLLNDTARPEDNHWDQGQFIARQLLENDHTITPEDPYLRVGPRLAGCLTPKGLPSAQQLRVLPLLRAVGPDSGRDHYEHDYLWVTTLFERPAHQRKAWRWAPDATAGREEQGAAPRVSVLTCLWLFASTEQKLRTALAESRTAWEAAGFVLQQERPRLSFALFLSSLPFGYYNTAANAETIRRDFRAGVAVAAQLLPLQAEPSTHTGTALLSRRGQLVQVSLTSESSHPLPSVFLCAGQSGVSRMTERLLIDSYATGSHVRVLSLDGAWMDATEVVGGSILSIDTVTPGLNPLLHASSPEQMDAASAIVLTMACSQGLTNISDRHIALTRAAVAAVIRDSEGHGGITATQDFLRKMADGSIDCGAIGERAVLAPIAAELAACLSKFADGAYSKLFNGSEALEVSETPWALLDLRKLSRAGDVLAVAALASAHRLLLGSPQAGHQIHLLSDFPRYFADLPPMNALLVRWINQSAAQKISFGLACRSLLDLTRCGPAGRWVWERARWKFLAPSNEAEVEVLVKAGWSIDIVTQELAKSIARKRDTAEVLIEAPHGALIASAPCEWASMSPRTSQR